MFNFPRLICPHLKYATNISLPSLKPLNLDQRFNFTSKFFLCTSPLRLWNRNPSCRYPSKANHGARPDCRSLRKIRKRLRTGK